MGIPRDIIDANPYLQDDPILVGYRGSIAHGTYTKSTSDDKDLMVVVVPEISNYFGLNQFGSRGTKELMQGDWDIVTYEFLKFVGLLIKGNPNVLSLLWLPDNLYVNVTPEGNKLIGSRHLFVSKQIYHSFVGYAHGQLHRMVHFKKTRDMGEKRWRLVEKFGYDTKNASHLIRLLRMGIEFLNEGEMHVQREDATQLLEIKNGGWSLEKVKKEAEHLFKRAERVYDNSTLPNGVDTQAINALCVDILKGRLIGAKVYG